MNSLSAVLGRPRRESYEIEESARIEQVLATARAFLAFGSLFAIYVDPSEPTGYAGLAYVLLAVYAIHSVLALILTRARPTWAPALGPVLHAIDIISTVIITYLTEGGSSPFFVFFVFVLLAAAYRWGLHETVVTGLAANILVLVETGVMHQAGYEPRSFELTELVMRSVYLLLATFLLGYLAEEEKALRADASRIARIMTKVRVEAGLRASIQGVFGELMALVGATRALITLEERDTGRTFLWDAARQPGTRESTIGMTELAPAERGRYRFKPPGPVESWGAVKRRGPAGRGQLSLVALDGQGRRVARGFSVPEQIVAPFAWHSLLSVPVTFGAEFTGRLLLLSRHARRRPERELRFVGTTVRQIGPALYSLYLLRRLRARASAIERARVARELHDGVIQSLIGLEMEIDVLRRDADRAPVETGAKLAHIQRLLRQEVANVRDLMQQLQPTETESRNLLEVLAEVVERFRHQTGIGASFVCDLNEVELAPQICRELGRIVQEALVNVRRHSGATTVVVRFGSRDGVWQLIIDDNGRGLDFAGRLSQEALDRQRRGPVVIKERVRLLGGTLAVDSQPGAGLRLEISIPQKPVPAADLLVP